MKKRFLSLALALALCLGLAAPVLAADGDFTIEDGVLTSYNGSGGDVVIPDGVTSIGEVAFHDCSLSSVTIPSSVTSIGDGAFYWCERLTSVTIPNSVTSIGELAFAHCTSLSSITIPSSVTSIGRGAFIDCTSLTSVTIPESITSISNELFLECSGLTSVTIPSSVTSIGELAFSCCTSLTSVTIPGSVTRIDGGAFDICFSLTSVTIPSSVTRIDGGAFGNCDSLTDVYYGGSEAQWKAIDINNEGDFNKPLLDAVIHYNSPMQEDPAPTTPAPAVSSFSDVKEGDYFAQPVAWAVEQKITNGTSEDTFSPNENCTVAQILTFLSRAKGSPEPAGTASLPGVDTGAYYYKPAAWALEQGLTDSFSPNAPCTRSMVVTYLWKLAGSPKAGASKFSDVPAGADYAQAVAWAVDQGITSGTSGTTFSPDDACTRGQIVTFLYRAFVK